MACPPIGKGSLVDGQVERGWELKQCEASLAHAKGQVVPRLAGLGFTAPPSSARWSWGDFEGTKGE